MFADGEELLADQVEYDVILLDISLNQDHDIDTLNGMDVAKKIREKSNAIIIFVTALKEYVFEGYDVRAFHYLLKPVDEQKFMEVMNKAINPIQREKNAEPLIIKIDGNYIKIPENNIILLLDSRPEMNFLISGISLEPDMEKKIGRMDNTKNEFMSNYEKEVRTNYQEDYLMAMQALGIGYTKREIKD